ncbi:BRO family, N-terminal domain [Azotobacter beijerinckii]|uniref:BRO family, N-terminal domain n=1 Tax=Azotobacter beijerinckii TaxID=170623 RepID=A0A1H9DCL7_9GAMM|nr:Bro-N domain-containing protein [Azotobacter beijerinckii]SEQ11121.1 BRO family, N-terminal domain [Azotobacter beijerinckii]
MANVIPFSFDQHPVRVIERDGELWFVAGDVAEALEYRDAGNMIRNLDDDEADTHIVSTRSDNGVEQDRELLIINESGLYAAILKSRKPAAKRFKKWVTSEVLPSIRKTGRYEHPDADAIRAEMTEVRAALTDTAVKNAAWDLIHERPELFLRDLRLLVSWDWTGQPQAQVIPRSAVVMQSDQLAGYVGDRFGPALTLLPDIIEAAAKRLGAAVCLPHLREHKDE